MLVIRRKTGQTVRIGEAVVTLLTSGDGVSRIAIEAPREVSIVRGELEGGGCGTRRSCVPHGESRQGERP